jgi:hypothetical protein
MCCCRRKKGQKRQPDGVLASTGAQQPRVSQMAVAETQPKSTSLHVARSYSLHGTQVNTSPLCILPDLGGQGLDDHAPIDSVAVRRQRKKKQEHSDPLNTLYSVPMTMPEVELPLAPTLHTHTIEETVDSDYFAHP